MSEVAPWLDDNENDSELVDKGPCPNEDCGSSDAFAIYDDGHGYCFSCQTYVPNVEDPVNKEVKRNTMSNPISSNRQTVKREIPWRNLSKDTCSFYGVETIVRNNEASGYLFPYFDDSGELTGYKIRDKDQKKFAVEGKLSPLFGMDKFPAGQRSITVTEGEFDALAAYELQGSKYPCVSIPNGVSDALKSCKKAYKYLDSFEKIVVCFDNDEPGREAASKVAQLFPGKALVCTLPKYKDANEYLMNNDRQGFIDAWWKAAPYTPEGIVTGEEVLELIKKRKEVQCIPSPWEDLDRLTYGFRLSEMWTITAGSGMGKTQVLRELEHHFLKTTPHNIGALFLEEPAADAALGLMSIEANKPLHLPDCHYTPDEFNAAADATIRTQRVYFLDAFGCNDIDRIITLITYMAKALDCKVIFLDHISLLVSEQSNGDERKALDEIATKLKKLTMQLDILLLMVSHSKRPNGKSHEEGGTTSLSELRGTAGIGQLSNMVLGLERNGQAEDEQERNTTLIRVLKNRFSGMTGPSCRLLYSRITGRLQEVDSTEVEDNDETP